ncbi:MAG: hypothetical protein LQ351_001382 [Letrouitia transgressa]|nr:MAG: hypothetical protein LQ351_001382 [Letrouitia transgressa]
MGKPRLIILIRHAQSEGNKNREIHQTVPDHRVKLTPDGWKQAEKAGLKLRSLLRPDDTLHFFTSPYRRTRETTEGILNALTSSDPNPSPFQRHTIKVYEEPRLREQDFGNFQPGSSEMARMWKERAEYGHFFYRIPSGESAADAYDRVSGFNDTLWRSFGEDDFASVCVLVTHGLMTRVFLMKWYHFSVEYFEDLRNVEHCEFIVMKRSAENGKYILQNELRTWSQLRKERAEIKEPESPIPVRKRWGGRPDSFENLEKKRLTRRQNTADMFADDVANGQEMTKIVKTKDDGLRTDKVRSSSIRSVPNPEDDILVTGPQNDKRSGDRKLVVSYSLDIPEGGRDGGGSRSGAPSRSGSTENEEPTNLRRSKGKPNTSSMALALQGELGGLTSANRAMADALGDQSEAEDNEQAYDSRYKAIH